MATTELDIFKTAQLPTYLQEGLDASTKALMGSANNRRISIKGGVFRMVVNGKEVAKSDDRAQQWIIVRNALDTGRMYFAGTYQEGKTVTPTCWSSDSKTPDASVPAPQASNCAQCPQNVKGSGQGEGRACRFSHRIAVALPNKPDEVYQVVLPSQSIFGDGAQNKWPFRAYGKYLAQNGVNLRAVVTEARFDTDSPTPKLTFRPVRLLTDEEYASMAAVADSEEAKRACTLTVTIKEDEADAEPFEQAPPPAAKPTVAATTEDSEPVKRGGTRKTTEVKNPAAVVAQWASE